LTAQSTKKRILYSILVVDDEPDITLTLKAGLERVGLFDVEIFNYPELVLSSFKPNFYALALIDIMMPKMNGFELYEQLKKIDPRVNVCFLTASGMYYEENRRIAHSALNKDLFLQKPISVYDLIKQVNKKINSKNNGSKS
jgi:two-component system, OmpR family, response regulator ChvI